LVKVDVNIPTEVFVRRTILVDVLVVFGLVRMMGVATEGVVATTTGVELTAISVGTSVGKGIPDASVRGVVIAGSVPR
jgi:hypothetical protein